MFKEGDRVVYTGDFTDEFKGLTGTVIRCCSPTNIQVKWDKKPYGWGDTGGVFPDNLTLIPLKLEETLNEIQQYKKKVLEVALRVKDQEDWCDEEFWPAMEELGIDKPKPPKWYPKGPGTTYSYGQVYQIPGYVIYIACCSGPSHGSPSERFAVIGTGTGEIQRFPTWEEAIDSVRHYIRDGSELKVIATG